jgi:Flp pilus assembly pilin Flp
MFTQFCSVVQSLKANSQGIAALEYGILGAVVLTAIVTAVNLVAGDIPGIFSTLAASLTSP